MFGLDMRVAKIVWTTALVCVLIYFIYAIGHTLLVLTFAVFFSYLVYPLIAFVERRTGTRVSRTVSISGVFALVFLLLMVAGSLLGSQLTDEASKLGEQLPTLFADKNIAERIPLPGFLQPMREKLVAVVAEQLQGSAGQAIPFAQKVASHLLHALSSLIYLVLVPVLSFLLIREAPAIEEKLLTWIPRGQRSAWARILAGLDTLMAGYVRALLILSLATAVVYSTAFSLLGLSYALLLGVVAGLLEVIPFVGPLMAAAGVLLISAFLGYPHLLWLLGFIVCYRVFQDYVLNPYLMSAGIEVSPLLVIVGLLAGDQIAGVPGIFLAVPAIAACKVVLSEIAAGKARAGSSDDLPGQADIPSELAPVRTREADPGG
jgi:predicted PurR-regulated permease PerM